MEVLSAYESISLTVHPLIYPVLQFTSAAISMTLVVDAIALKEARSAKNNIFLLLIWGIVYHSLECLWDIINVTNEILIIFTNMIDLKARKSWGQSPKLGGQSPKSAF